MTAEPSTVVLPAVLMRQFKEAPPGKLYCLHGSNSVFRLSLWAAAHALLNDVPVTVVDGTNRFDVYYLAEFARSVASRGGGSDPGRFLEKIFVSRAFTCYQMEAVITERLPAFVRRSRSPIVVIFGLLDTFYDEQAPLFEVQASLQRVIAALRTLRQENISVLLASVDVKLAARERNALFPRLLAAMDRVYHVTSTDEGTRIVREPETGKILPQNHQGTRTGHGGISSGSHYGMSEETDT
jgi:hypothetical protein